jgi:hypothetical protein
MTIRLTVASDGVEANGPYFPKIDKNYPRINGQSDVPYWPRPVNGKPVWEH